MSKISLQSLPKYYTRFIGIAFTLVVISLLTDLAKFGFRPESMHKIFHVILGGVVVKLAWNNSSWWLPFCFVNGGLFTFIALFGWIYPDFGQLDAFNFVDTLLHTIVGISGLVIGFIELKKSRHTAQNMST